MSQTLFTPFLYKVVPMCLCVCVLTCVHVEARRQPHASSLGSHNLAWCVETVSLTDLQLNQVA